MHTVLLSFTVQEKGLEPRYMTDKFRDLKCLKMKDPSAKLNFAEL